MISLKIVSVVYICRENIKKRGYLVVFLTKLLPIERTLNIIDYSIFKVQTQILGFSLSIVKSSNSNKKSDAVQ